MEALLHGSDAIKRSNPVLDQLHNHGTRLTRLRAKLAARTDSTGAALVGYEKNTDALRAEIARLENMNLTTVADEPEASEVDPDPPAVASRRKSGKRYRSAETGRFITPDEAYDNPATTVGERVRNRTRT
jgi:hypothetical protein